MTTAATGRQWQSGGLRSVTYAGAIFLLLLVMAGCEPALVGEGPPKLGASAWEAVSVAGAPSIDGKAPFIRFDGSHLSGLTGCNDFEAIFETTGSRVQITDLSVTKKACSNPALHVQEQVFLEALGGATELSMSGDRLQLRGAGGAIEMVLTTD